MSQWRAEHVGTEGDDLTIGGVAVWRAQWRQVPGERVTLPHPAYANQSHSFTVFEIGDPDNPIRFAAGEVSNGVWGFYVPD